jgi:hypothetical protein
VKTGIPILESSSQIANEDTFVRPGDASHGGDTDLVANYDPGSPDRTAYATRIALVKFPIDNKWKNNQIKNAKLKLYVYGKSNNTYNPTIMEVIKTTNSWDETTIWTTKPQLGEVISSCTVPTSTTGWIEVDVSDYLAEVAASENATNISFAFAIPMGTYVTGQVAWCNIKSSEAGTTNQRPELIVESLPSWYNNSNALLKSISLDGVSLSGFAPTTFEYNYTLNSNFVRLPYVFATATEGAQVNIDVKAPTQIPGSAIITATSKDGNSKSIYKINISRN